MNIKQRRLPSAYQEVEWIGATRTQYIDTGFKPNSNFTLEIEWQYNSHTQGVMEIFTGSVDSHTGTTQRLYLGRVGMGTTYEDILWGANRITHGEWDTLKHSDMLEYNGTNTILTHDGVRTVYDYVNPYSMLDTSLSVFGYKRNDGVADSIPNGQIYKYKITSNGSAYLNLIPCYRISDSVIGMYDTVNGVFYNNQGTGSFTKGADVVTLESMTIPDGNVIRINDGNGNLLWKRHLFDFKDFVDKLVSFGASTGTDANGFYVNLYGGTVNEKVIIEEGFFKENKSYKFYLKGYNINTSNPSISNTYVKRMDGSNSVLDCNMNGFTRTYTEPLMNYRGTFYTQTAKIYDFYVDEVS